MYKIGINLKQRDLIAVLCALSMDREPHAQSVVTLITTTPPDHCTHDAQGRDIDARYTVHCTRDQLDCMDRCLDWYANTLSNLAIDIKDVPVWAMTLDRVPLCLYPAITK